MAGGLLVWQNPESPALGRSGKLLRSESKYIPYETVEHWSKALLLVFPEPEDSKLKSRTV